MIIFSDLAAEMQDQVVKQFRSIKFEDGGQQIEANAKCGYFYTIHHTTQQDYYLSVTAKVIYLVFYNTYSNNMNEQKCF